MQLPKVGTEAILRTPAPGPFISAPGDMDQAATRIIKIFQGLRIPGGRLKPHYWRKDFDSFAATAALPTQVQIARTSAETVDPIIVLFGEKLGTPVTLPAADQRSLRRRLDMEQMERLSFEEMRNFLRTSNEARFVM